eukprot:6473188-Alexandrium_andersonii.AAC.1
MASHSARFQIPPAGGFRARCGCPPPRPSRATHSARPHGRGALPASLPATGEPERRAQWPS